MKKITFFLILFSPIMVFANHLLGGTIELKWLGGNSYKLSVHVLRECNSSPTFDESIVVGLFEKGTDSLKNYFSFGIINFETLQVPENCSKKYSICSQLGIYSQIITLDSNIYNNDSGYYFSWQRCCRSSKTNIGNRNDFGLCLYLEVPNLKKVKNSSPIYKNSPSILLYTGMEFNYNLEFLDPDNDNLKFSFVTPLKGQLDNLNPRSAAPIAGPYPNVFFANGYSNENLLGGTRALKIDSNTGNIYGTAGNSGSFLIGIRVEEFRLGQKIGEVRLEIEVNVVVSSKPSPQIILANIDNQEITGDTITIHTPDSFFFKIFGSTPNDSIYLELELPDSAIIGFNEKPIFQALSSGYLKCESSFRWQSYCQMQDSGNYVPIKISAFDNDCPIKKFSSKNIVLKISDLPVLKGPNEVCVGSKGIEFSLPENLNKNNYTWTLPVGINGSSITNKITTDFAPEFKNGNIFVNGINACGNNFSLNHPITSVEKPDKPTITLWGNSIHSSVVMGNQWFRNDSLILGATKKYYELKTNGNYYTIVNLLGCKSDPSDAINITFMSVADLNPAQIPQVFPNPFLNYVKIISPAIKIGSEYEMVNNLGQTMAQGILNSQFVIQTENFPSGLYILILKSGDSIFYLKLIKED